MPSPEPWLTGDPVTALLGAVIGSILTLAGDIGIRTVFERRRSRSYKDAVYHELGVISSEVARRLAHNESQSIRVAAPLPTAAWQQFVHSGHFRHLSEDSQQALTDFYRQIDNANYMTQVALNFLQTASLTEKQEVSRAFQEEADRLTSQPFHEIGEILDDTKEIVAPDHG